MVGFADGVRDQSPEAAVSLSYFRLWNVVSARPDPVAYTLYREILGDQQDVDDHGIAGSVCDSDEVQFGWM